MPETLVGFWGIVLWGKIKPLIQHFARGLTQTWPLKFMYSMKHLSGFDNILEAEA